MRSITVASGKGGTGKTTLSALFAHMAAESLNVVVADADVEASNLPLALRLEHGSCEVFEGGLKAVIRADRCSACGVCAEACRFGAISVDDERYRVDAVVCEGCGTCAYVCPLDAVSMVRQKAGEACTGMSVVGPIAYGQLRPGYDLSGKLVTEVRSRAVALGAVHGADVLIIDGPPGTGCPAIASITGTDLIVAVAEPTRSGAHDLGRLETLARRFALGVVVVLNKADLSSAGAREVRDLCTARDLPLLAEIPFDPALVDALAGLASGATLGDMPAKSQAMRIVRETWEQLDAMLSESGPAVYRPKPAWR